MIYTTLEAVKANLHGMFESSRLASTDNGHIHDALVVNGENTPIDVDNGVAVKMGEYTGNGLQERYATIAQKADKIAVVGTPALIKDAKTQMEAQPYNFYVKAGVDAKVYEVNNDKAEVFAVADYQIKGDITVGATVVVDGKGAYEVISGDTSTYGFVGKVHSISTGTFFTMVRIAVEKNVQL